MGWLPRGESIADAWADRAAADDSGENNVRREAPGVFNTDDSDEASQAIVNLVDHVCAAIGKRRDDFTVRVDFLESYHGQQPQEFHQDGPNPVLAAMVFLNESSEATRYGSYVGRDFHHMPMIHDRLAFLRDAWDKTLATDDWQGPGTVNGGTVLRQSTEAEPIFVGTWERIFRQKYGVVPTAS